MSVLDFLKPSDDEFMTAYYWEHIPKPNERREEGRQTFRYSKVTGSENRFNTVATNVRLDTLTYRIRTCDDCGFKIGGVVSTQNGEFWMIESVMRDEQTQGNEEALLFWKSGVKNEYILYLRSLDNPWSIGK